MLEHFYMELLWPDFARLSRIVKSTVFCQTRPGRGTAGPLMPVSLTACLQDLLASGMQVGIPIIMRYKLSEGSVEIKSNSNLVITRNKDEVNLWQYFQTESHWNCLERING